MTSTPEGIDALIARHKEALKSIETTKNLFQNKQEKATALQLPFIERVRTHFRTHAGTWTTVIYSGCILVLSLRLVSLRREFAAEKEELQRRNGRLHEENSKLLGYVAEMESSWYAILKEVQNGGWRSASLVERVEKIIDETKARKQDSEVTAEEDQKGEEKPKRFLIG